ncbi:TraR/DksA C4-type zinc finger protein [Paenarthrobacter sp. Z7-10]|uniref:TraR/DksA family transcriptional regulator n=1 Tax=Paenarthrobacter sp. Z7-10 TaxID=2787635 RepID=UPI0022A98095|nr:TraR/DksA C4-type zinc finger protein [Paenarthrobacter sp. Z7-10]MCZ2401883.1 TraR/DksA C4-type zinc finger protein [Paenarthrobacter sp. Z7-10]
MGEMLDNGVAASPNAKNVFGQLLLQRLTDARAHVARLNEEIREVTLARRDTPADDEHDPEGSTVTLEREHDVALLLSAEGQVAELIEAQSRLAKGTYGSCERCGQPIPRERLAVRPEVRFCVPCASIRSKER